MWKLTTLLTCAFFIGCVGTSAAAPLDSPGTVYIDGTPCNRPCQTYMAWSRSLLPQQETVANEQSPSQVVQRKPHLKAHRQISRRSRAPTSVAKKAVPKNNEVSLANSSAQPAEIREGKSAAPEKITDAPPVPDTMSDSETGTTSEKGLTAPAVENLTTANQGPTQELDSDTQPTVPPEAAAPADVEMTALAPDNAEPQVAILLVRPEIKSVSDLANKIVAIDGSQSGAAIGSVRTAIVAAGATEVQMSEGSTLAIERVMNGEVPAAVVSIVDPEAAAAWSAGRPGFKIFQIRLSPARL